MLGWILGVGREGYEVRSPGKGQGANAGTFVQVNRGEEV